MGKNKKGKSKKSKVKVKKAKAKKEKKVKKRKSKSKKKKEKMKKVEANPEFLCPINYNLMSDPVIVRQSGCTYERKSIVDWIGQSGTCPNSRAKITVNDLIPNHTLRKAIENWKQENNINAS